jgi:hypothetical protein
MGCEMLTEIELSDFSITGELRPAGGSAARKPNMTASAFTKGTVVARENSTDRLRYP